MSKGPAVVAQALQGVGAPFATDPILVAPVFEKLIPQYSTMDESNDALINDIGEKINAAEDLKYFVKPEFLPYVSQTLSNDVEEFLKTSKITNTIHDRFEAHIKKVFSPVEFKGGEKLSDFVDAKARRIANTLCLTNGSSCKKPVKLYKIIERMNTSIKKVANNFNQQFFTRDTENGKVHYDNVMTDQKKSVGDVIRTIFKEIDEQFVQHTSELTANPIQNQNQNFGGGINSKRRTRKARKYKKSTTMNRRKKGNKIGGGGANEALPIATAITGSSSNANAMEPPLTPLTQIRPVYMPFSYVWQTVRDNVGNNVGKRVEIKTLEAAHQIMKWNVINAIARQLFDYSANSKLTKMLKTQFDAMIEELFFKYIKTPDKTRFLVMLNVMFLNNTGLSLFQRILEHKKPGKIASSFIGDEPNLTYPNNAYSYHSPTVTKPTPVHIPPNPPVPEVLKSGFNLEKYEKGWRFFSKSKGAYIEPVFNGIMIIFKGIETDPTEINHVYYAATIEFCNRMLFLFTHNKDYVQWKIRQLLFSGPEIQRDYFENTQKNAKIIWHHYINYVRPLAHIMSLFAWVKLIHACFDIKSVITKNMNWNDILNHFGNTNVHPESRIHYFNRDVSKLDERDYRELDNNIRSSKVYSPSTEATTQILSELGVPIQAE